MAKYQLPRGQAVQGGRFWIRPGSIVDDASGTLKVTYCPDGSNVGNAVPQPYTVPPDAVPYDQSSYNAMRALYANRDIVTHNDVAAGIVRTLDPSPPITPPYPVVNQHGVIVGFQNTPVTTAYGDHI